VQILTLLSTPQEKMSVSPVDLVEEPPLIFIIVKTEMPLPIKHLSHWTIQSLLTFFSIVQIHNYIIPDKAKQFQPHST